MGLEYLQFQEMLRTDNRPRTRKGRSNLALMRFLNGIIDMRGNMLPKPHDPKAYQINIIEEFLQVRRKTAYGRMNNLVKLGYVQTAKPDGGGKTFYGIEPDRSYPNILDPSQDCITLDKIPVTFTDDDIDRL